MILLSAGHHPGAKGASYNGHNEHDEAIVWVSEISNLIRGRMPVDIVPAWKLFIRDPATKKVIGGKIPWINQQKHVSIACEIHFNSDESKRQSGSETLYCPGSVVGKAAAEMVQKALGGIFPPSRGAKEGWYQMNKSNGPDAFLSETRCVALIVEPEFIYNWQTIQDRRSPACAALADALIEAATSITGET